MIETEKLKPHLIYFSFLLLLFSSFKESSSNKNPDIKVSKSDNISQTIDSIPLVKLQKEIDGEEVIIEFSIDQKFDEYGQRVLWSQKREGMEYPMEVKEIRKGVIIYPRFTSYITPNGTVAKGFREKLLEFYDEEYKLISHFDIVENNPYLKDTIAGAKLTEYFYNIAERYRYLINKEIKKKISQQWVYARAYIQDSLVIIDYNRLLASTDGYIVGAQYHFIVLDIKGNIIAKLQSEHDHLIGVSFGPDGKYAILGYTPGETASNAGIKSEKDGFEIWDLKKNKIIYKEENHDPNKWISSVSFLNDYLSVYFDFPNNEELVSEWKAFNIKSHKLYTHTVTKDMLKNGPTSKSNTCKEIIELYSIKSKTVGNE
ncbi:hypothetical protein N9L92_03860 [Saprospiraceae bacterium]|nr:hypothetical protein [Saprospiraceae bacterium]